MATLMTWGNSDGIKGRCDANCHNASSPASQCKCMCRGAYHGATRRGELDQIRRQRGMEIMAAATIYAQEQGYQLRSVDNQLPLPGF